MKHIKESLHRALAQARFEVQSERREDRGKQDSLRTPHQIRQVFELAKWDDPDLQGSIRAQVIVPETLLVELADRLRVALGDYLDPDSDSIGHAFPFAGGRGGRTTATPDGLYTVTSCSSVISLCKDLVRGAAVLGVDSVFDLLDGWIQGEPVRYYTSTVVGLPLGTALSPLDGISFFPLPLHTDDLPSWLPSSTRTIHGADYLGHAVVSVASETSPALFLPGSINDDGCVGVKLSPGIPLDIIWEALALECNAYIQTGLRWNDHRDFFALTGGFSFMAGGLSHMYHPTGSTHTTTVNERSGSRGTSELSLPEGATRELRENALQQTLSSLKSADARTRMAVRRWRKSIQPIGDLADRFIDLRIALESLFLADNARQEMKFRLAVNAAWLLGEDAKDRRRIWESIRKSYDAASKAVHTGDFDRHQENRTLLADAQCLCRKGIRRMLGEGRVSDWPGLILGSNVDPHAP